MVVRHKGVAYFLQVKPRLTTWLMAAFLAVAATFGVPVSRVAPARVSYGIVCIDVERHTHQSVSEARETLALPQSQTSPALQPTNVLHLGSPLEQSLFQRPPPAAFFPLN
jgi:hypothetical protein